MKLLTFLRDTYCLLRPTANPQSGFMFVAIILIVLVIFSISIVSGADDFTFSPDPTGKPSPSTSPTATPSAGTVTPTPANTAGWKITVKNINCEGSKAKGDGELAGDSNGYIALEIKESDGSYKLVDTDEFYSPLSTLVLTLENNKGFQSAEWRLKLFSGGTKTDTTWTGGVERAVHNGSPTGCT